MIEIYNNEDKKCECWKCEKQTICVYKDRYQRLPRTSPGALGLCPKLKIIGGTDENCYREVKC